MLGNLIGGFIVILVGITLAPVVADNVQLARLNASGGTDGSINVTGAASTILGLTTLFYVLAIASAAIGIATLGLRNSGLM
jgi:lysozyme family protein